MRCSKCGIKLKTFKEKIVGKCENCLNWDNYVPKKEGKNDTRRT
jgi:predicted ATP-dependent serine protease